MACGEQPNGLPIDCWVEPDKEEALKSVFDPLETDTTDNITGGCVGLNLCEGGTNPDTCDIIIDSIAATKAGQVITVSFSRLNDITKDITLNLTHGGTTPLVSPSSTFIYKFNGPSVQEMTISTGESTSDTAYSLAVAYRTDEGSPVDCFINGTADVAKTDVVIECPLSSSINKRSVEYGESLKITITPVPGAVISEDIPVHIKTINHSVDVTYGSEVVNGYYIFKAGSK